MWQFATTPQMCQSPVCHHTHEGLNIKEVSHNVLLSPKHWCYLRSVRSASSQVSPTCPILTLGTQPRNAKSTDCPEILCTPKSKNHRCKSNHCPLCFILKICLAGRLAHTHTKRKKVPLQVHSPKAHTSWDWVRQSQRRKLIQTPYLWVARTQLPRPPVLPLTSASVRNWTQNRAESQT